MSLATFSHNMQCSREGPQDKPAEPACKSPYVSPYPHQNKVAELGSAMPPSSQPEGSAERLPVPRKGGVMSGLRKGAGKQEEKKTNLLNPWGWVSVAWWYTIQCTMQEPPSEYKHRYTLCTHAYTHTPCALGFDCPNTPHKAAGGLATTPRGNTRKSRRNDVLPKPPRSRPALRDGNYRETDHTPVCGAPEISV
jgi:hypothetical protein